MGEEEEEDRRARFEARNNYRDKYLPSAADQLLSRHTRHRSRFGSSHQFFFPRLLVAVSGTRAGPIPVSLGRTRDTPTLVHLASPGHHRGSISPWIIRPIALRAACTQPIKCVGIPGVFPRLTRDTLHRLANTVVHRAITTPREGRPLIRFREFADGLLCRFWGPGPSFKGRHPDLSTGCRE